MVDNPKNSVFTKDPEVIPFMTCAKTPLVVPKTSSGSESVIHFTIEECINRPETLLALSCFKRDKVELNSLPISTAARHNTK